jgi:hypothetical protein
MEVTVTSMTLNGQTQLQLTPANDRQTFELLPGPDGRDALQSLGLTEGMVRNTVVDKTKGVIPADKGPQTYGLHLNSKLDLASPTDIKAALDGITNAITTVRAVYADLKQAATPQTPGSTATQGAVPAYLQAQIADYSAALARLSGSDTSGSSSSGSSLVSLFS